jgi:hypothetical protein
VLLATCLVPEESQKSPRNGARHGNAVAVEHPGFLRLVW